MTFCNTFYSLLGAPRPFDPTHKYTTSYLISPLALALIRLLFSLYAFVAIFFQLAYESTVSDPDQRWTARHSLSYFTNLCYWGLAFYYLFSGLHTLAYRFDTRASTGEEETWGNGKDVANGGHLPPARRSFWGYLNLNNWPRPLQALHTIFYSSVMTFSPLVTIVFWAVLYRGPWWPDDFDQWKNISVHALNTLPALLTILFTNTPPSPPLHLLALIILLALYLGLAYLTHTVDGFYPYSFLNPADHSQGIVAAYIIGILVGACIIFGLVWVATWGRQRIVGRSAKKRIIGREADADAEVELGIMAKPSANF